MFLTGRAPIAVLVAALTGALVAWIGRWPVAASIGIADALILLVVAADVGTAPDPRSLRLRRVLPDAATIGEPQRVGMVIHNPTRRNLRAALRDASPPSLQRDPRIHRGVLPGGGTVELVSTICPLRRGRIPIGPITARTEGRAGLAGRQRRVDDQTTIRVFPALPGRAEVELRLQRARLLQSGERSSAVRGGGTEFDSLREYHLDDEFRRINWRATARAAKPISNVFREERNQQVVIVLDAGRTMAANLGGVSRFEHGIDAALTVAELAARIGDHVGVTAFGKDLVAGVPARGGRAQPGRILDALYAVEPSLDAPNYTQAFSTLLSRNRRRSLIVLITEITDAAAMEPLLRAVPALVRRHLVVVGAVLDPEIEQLALCVPGTSDEAFAKAAAAGSLIARADTAAKLRGIGVVVVDRPPGKLSGALADHYLRVKAFGRL